MTATDTPIGDSVERDLQRGLTRRRLMRRHRDALEVADWDEWAAPLREGKSVEPAVQS